MRQRGRRKRGVVGAAASSSAAPGSARRWASWERKPLENLAADGQLRAFRHTGFWKPMDTLRDKRELDSLWALGRAPWRRWKD